MSAERASRPAETKPVCGVQKADGHGRLTSYPVPAGLCLYNRNRLPAATLDHCLATHPHVRLEGNIPLDNPFYEEPEKAASRKTDGSAFHAKLEWLNSALAWLLGGGPTPDPVVAPIRH